LRVALGGTVATKDRGRRLRVECVGLNRLKEKPMSFASRIVLGAVFLLACLPAQAEQDQKQQQEAVKVQIASALVCDTQAQVERFVALFDGNVETALHAVNNEQTTRHACDVATIAYVMGPEVSTARSNGATFRVVRVLVLGVVTPDGIMKASVPTPFYSAAMIEEQEV
jgi:hypothetical protein